MSDPNFSDGKFSRLFGIMLLAMVALTGLLMMLANFASKDVNDRLDAEAAVDKAKVLASDLSPVGSLAVGEGATQTAVVVVEAEPKSGDVVYGAACAACHASGVAGAPRYGDTADWSARIAKGADTLYTNAINGVNGSSGYMPAKGGNPSLSDEEVKAAVDYILAGSQ